LKRRTTRTAQARILRATAGAAVLALTLAACGGGTEDDAADDADSEEAAADDELSAEDWEPEWVDGVLQPLPNGFPERPITLVNVDDAGTPSGLYTRAIQQAIEEGGLSPVDIRISDEPRAQGGTIHTVAEIYESREGGDQGYELVSQSLAGSATDFFVEPVTEETGLTIDDLNWVVATEIVPYVMQTRHGRTVGRGLRRVHRDCSV
jgi:hypothetical protein